MQTPHLRLNEVALFKNIFYICEKHIKKILNMKTKLIIIANIVLTVLFVAGCADNDKLKTDSKNLFLASYFPDVADLLSEFAGEDLTGKIVVHKELKRTGADTLIIEEIKKGKLYIGCSAGSIIASKNIEYIADIMDSTEPAPDLNGNYSTLDIVDFYIVPHCITNASVPPSCEESAKKSLWNISTNLT